MKVLITGCNGQLGTELRYVLNRGISELGPLPKALQNAQVTGIGSDTVDICDQQAVRDLVREVDPDVLINCAAYTNVNGCESDSDTAFRVNALGPRNLAGACRENGAKIIHLSTDYVFSGDGNMPYNEWDVCSPQSVYGHTKHLGELYVREITSQYFIVRTAWLYGYAGGNFVKTILKTVRERGLLKVVDDQRGNPTNAADLAHHLLKLAATEEYGIYHCTGNGECSWYDFALEIIKLSGIHCAVSPCTTEEFPTPAKRPAYSSLDNRMLRCTVGDEMRDWKDAIAAYMANYDRKRGEIRA